MAVRVVSVSQLAAATDRTWALHLQPSWVASPSAESAVTDPLSDAERDELTWYWESYASQDPFAAARAGVAERLLEKYTANLKHALEQPISSFIDVGEKSAEQVPIVLRVLGDGSRSSIHALRWELLERPAIWTGNFKIVTVMRTPDSSMVPLPHPTPSESRGLNLLFVSARPGMGRDISYRLISRTVWELRQQHNSVDWPINISFVRPGTWQEFRSALQASPKGHFFGVHFDMHGSLSKTDQKAVLHFSPSHDGSGVVAAAIVAEELRSHEVPHAILNACYTAQTERLSESNLAYTFAQSGVGSTIAMSAWAKADTVAAFMESFYAHLFSSRVPVSACVPQAREQMRSQPTRLGRFGTSVKCEDDCLVVLYQHSGFLEASTLGSNSLSRAQNLSELEPRTLGIDQDLKSPFSEDLELLSLEYLLEEHSGIIIHGRGGTGKTSLVKNLLPWWKSTGFALRTTYFDLQENTPSDLVQLYKSIIEQPPQDTPAEEKAKYAHVYVMDNLESLANAGHEEFASARHDLRKFLNLFGEVSADHRVLLISRLSAPTLDSMYPEVERFEKTPLSARESADLFMKISQAGNESAMLGSSYYYQLENILHKCEYDLFSMRYLGAVVREFDIPLCELSAKVQDDLDLGYMNPKLGLHPRLVTSSGMLSQISGRLESLRASKSTDAAYWVVLSLAAFRRVVPYDLRQWLFRLMENKFIPLEGIPSFENTHPNSWLVCNFHLAEQPEPVKQIFEELQAKWQSLREELVVLGALDAMDPSGESTATHITVHPFFRFILRQEIFTSLGSQGRRYLESLQTAFCDLYEAQAIPLARLLMPNSDEGASALTEFLEREEEDILEACRLTVAQSTFPSRIYSLHAMTTQLLVIYLSLPRGRLMELADICLLVLNRFQQITTRGEWARLTDRDLSPRAKAVIRVLQLGKCRHICLKVLRLSSENSQNAEFTLRLADSLAGDLQ